MTAPSDARLRDIFVDMLIARTQAGRLWNLQRQGQVGTVAPIDGHEATIVGAAHALDPEHDWVVPQYREPLGLRRYGPEILERFMLYNLGHPAGGHIPEPIRVLPNQIALATQIPHAVGIAWGMTLRDEPGVALAFFGDGSSSEGDFYEAGNLAGVLGAPVIMLCVNNQWAISTPVHLQTAADSFAAKAAAFGIPGVLVDGNDASAVYDAGDEARSRALAGRGPPSSRPPSTGSEHTPPPTIPPGTCLPRTSRRPDATTRCCASVDTSRTAACGTTAPRRRQRSRPWNCSTGPSTGPGPSRSPPDPSWTTATRPTRHASPVSGPTSQGGRNGERHSLRRPRRHERPHNGAGHQRDPPR